MNDYHDAVAVIGYALQAPASDDIEQFWSNLTSRKNLISRFSREELISAGYKLETIEDPTFVPTFGVLNNSDCFDNQFFGYTARDAQLMDPQQRIFLESTWNAIENAGYDPLNCDNENVGIFAGCSLNKYFLLNLMSNPEVMADFSPETGQGIPDFIASDYISLRTAYNLGLSGPALTVQTACSSGLTAIAMACQHLTEYRCNLAVAGASSVSGKGPRGYTAQHEGMLSPKGICRPFDQYADGSVFGDGVGTVVLKRYDEAVRDGDPIKAVIRGWAVRNDGNNKAGFSAPSVHGQCSTIYEAIVSAGIDVETIGYVEAHGSGTYVGDPIEVEGLQLAFRQAGDKRQQGCVLGSVKGNTGHLDAAAGIVGFIKTVLCVERGLIPGTLHFKQANNSLNLDNSPFYVSADNVEFPVWGGAPRRAGISSIGMGGTNAHVVIEQYVPSILKDKSSSTDEPVALVFSSKTMDGLKRQIAEFSLFSAKSPSIRLQDAAYTLHSGRHPYEYRTTLVGKTWPECSSAAEALPKSRNWAIRAMPHEHCCYMFSGMGQQYDGMGADLYHSNSIFRSSFDESLRYARDILNLSLDWVITSPLVNNTKKDDAFFQMLGQPRESSSYTTTQLHTGLAAFEVAVFEMLKANGIRPDMLAGHSLGEYAAICCAGMITLHQMLDMVNERAKFIDKAPPGAMLSAPLTEKVAQTYTSERISIAAVNGRELITFSGSPEDIDALEYQLSQNDIASRRLDADKAFHSHLLSAGEGMSVDMLKHIIFTDPKIPVISALDGSTLTAKKVSDVSYWQKHMTQTVRWHDVVNSVANNASVLFIEIGPGAGLCSLIEEEYTDHPVHAVPLIPANYDRQHGLTYFRGALGKLWCHGLEVAFPSLTGSSKGRRTSIPTTSFERKPHWVEKKTSVSLTVLNKSPAIPADILLERVVSPITSSAPLSSVSTAVQSFDGRLAEQILDIWRKFFGSDVLTAHDDFLAAGGHSLLALQISNALWRKLNLKISVRTILELRTVNNIILWLEENSDMQNNSCQQSLLQEIETLDTTAKIQALERWLIDLIEPLLSLPRGTLTEESRLSREQLKSITADLIDSFRKAFSAPLYPNEIDQDMSIYELALLAKSFTESMTPLVISETEKVHSTQTPEKIPGVCMLLSSVRSGSTLLRVMLEGHTHLFSPPELHLLAYEDMEQRTKFENSPDRDQGIEIALTELAAGNRGLASAKVQQMNSENWKTEKVYRYLADQAKPSLLVDKSPGNANHYESLLKAEMIFDNPKYIFLVRHPYSVIESVMRNRFNKLMGADGISPQQFGDFLWYRSNSNITQFLSTISSERYLFIRYEDILENTERETKRICAFLDIPYQDALLHPYSGRRMRDGLGDPNLQTHDTIRIDYKEGWKNIQLPARLSRATAGLAQQLGYDLTLADAVSLPFLHSGTKRERSGNHNESLFLQCEIVPLKQGATQEKENIYLIHALDGTVDFYRLLADKLPNDYNVYGIALKTSLEDEREWDIDHLSSLYAECIVSHSKNNSFRIAGWSFGGMLAAITGEKLMQSCSFNGPVIVLDTPAPFNRMSHENNFLFALCEFAKTLFTQAGTTMPKSLDIKKLADMGREEAVQLVMVTLLRMNIVPESMLKNDFMMRLSVYEKNLNAASNYNRQTIDIPVGLIRANNNQMKEERFMHPNFEHEDGVYGWSLLTQQTVDIFPVSADHYTMLRHQSIEETAHAFTHALSHWECSKLQNND
ncbi:type I polyketide synthase [Samsonia erythrinae]|uniref:Acyl transferase domain-containing protein n=1 Tax=Samsonia erythrinae TaxID=160434 RepID=A0A4V2VTF4_9GAMM|nr:type I polyketide synthase [Samsonia erythrinae]TCV06346.1 acyl transferase domain-containing protein [Samsonia erythrinae]